MIFHAEYKKFVLLLRDWNIEHGLGVTQPKDRPLETGGPNEYDRTQMWQVGNCSLFVMTEGPDKTSIVLWPPEDGSPVDTLAIRTWDKLENLVNEVNALFEPVTINWRVSALEAWVNDNRRERNIQVMFFQPVRGPIQINHEVEGPGHILISLLAERLPSGQIEITPTYSTTPGGFPTVVNEIRLWRRELGQALMATGDTAVSTPNDQEMPSELRVYLKALRQKIKQRFSKEELRTLLADIIGNYEDIEREDKIVFVRELTLWFFRHQQLPHLVAALKERRPEEDWPEPPFS